MARQRIKKGLIFSTNPNKARKISEEYRKSDDIVKEKTEKDSNKNS